MTKKNIILGALLYAVAQTAAAIPFTYSSTDVPVAIPEGGGTSGVTTSTLDVGDNGTINDLNVFLDLDHTFIGDLEISIEHGGTSVLLRDNLGGAADDLTITYDDEGTAPLNALTAFDITNIFGIWTLTINDTLGGDTGTLVAWNINGDFTPRDGQVPEPGMLALFGIGLLGFAMSRKRKA